MSIEDAPVHCKKRARDLWCRHRFAWQPVRLYRTIRELLQAGLQLPTRRICGMALSIDKGRGHTYHIWSLGIGLPPACVHCIRASRSCYKWDSIKQQVGHRDNTGYQQAFRAINATKVPHDVCRHNARCSFLKWKERYESCLAKSMESVYGECRR